MMITVACVMVGNYCGRGPEYVEILHDMVRRNLPDGFPGRFVCFTDDPDSLRHLKGVETKQLPSGLHGWWNKLYLFAPEAFAEGERILYFDLDTVISGPLDRLVEYTGPFAILRDVYRHRDHMQSSVMAWAHGDYNIWSDWHRKGCPLPAGGDQDFIESFFDEFIPHNWLQDLYPGVLRSYKVDCVGGIPKGTSVVFFHGHPRPHEAGGWVNEIWKVGGGSTLEFVNVGTVPQESVLNNIRAAIAAGYPVLEPSDPHGYTACICGGGPSLKDQLSVLGSLQRGGAAIFSCNQVDGFLRKSGIQPNFHVMLDARPDLAKWVNEGGIKLYSSMCSPETLEAGQKAGDLTVWHPVTDGAEEIVCKGLLVGGGTTVGCRAITLAYAMGFRNILCFGFDSCYVDGDHHAYAQALNDGERVLDVVCAGRKFKAAPWMAQQAEDFKTICTSLKRAGPVNITVFGDGLIAAIASLGYPEHHSETRARAILSHLEGLHAPVGVEVGVFAGDLSARLLKAREDLKLFLVDNYGTNPSRAYRGTNDFHTELTREQQAKAFEMARHAVSFAGERAHFMRITSVFAARAFPNASLDFVFIDADHSYEGCRDDIKAWLPKVKPGGLICGHDYENPDLPLAGVRKAVDEAFTNVELGENYTWFKRIPA